MTKPSTPAAGFSLRSRPRAPWWRRVFARVPHGLDEATLRKRFSLEGDAAGALSSAFAGARRERRLLVSVVDLLWAMVQEGALRPLLEELRVDPSQLEPEGADREREETTALADEQLVRLLACAQAQAEAAGRESMGTPHLFASRIRFDKQLAADLGHVGIDLVSALTFASYGVTRHPFYDDKSAPAGEQLGIVVHNDDYTTQDLVVELLKQALALDDDKATELMMLVHDGAEMEVAVMERAEAIELVNEMLRAAREAEAPLKVSLRQET
jgi:ATP-dependent Clp protease adaptor protein ClpS